MAVRKGKPTLSDEEVRSVLEALSHLLAEYFEGSQTALGKAIDSTQASVSQLLSGKNRPSLKTVKGIALVLGRVTGRRVTYADVLEGKWREPVFRVMDSGGGVAQVVKLSNRRRAMHALQVLGERRERVEAAAREVKATLGTKSDPDPWWWLEQIKARMALDLAQESRVKPKE